MSGAKIPAFRCAKCLRKARDLGIGIAGGGFGGLGRNYRATGQHKILQVDPKPGFTTISREYECLTCGHVGWSRHIDLAVKATFQEDAS